MDYDDYDALACCHDVLELAKTELQKDYFNSDKVKEYLDKAIHYLECVV